MEGDLTRSTYVIYGKKEAEGVNIAHFRVSTDFPPVSVDVDEDYNGVLGQC